jgi:predicted metal-binding protein
VTQHVPARIKHVPANWQGMVLVCRKCTKRIGGGFGPKRKTALAKALRKELATKKDRKGSFGIAEVGCLGICPDNAVTLIDGTRPDDWLLIPRGSDIGDLAARLTKPDQSA